MPSRAQLHEMADFEAIGRTGRFSERDAQCLMTRLWWFNFAQPIGRKAKKLLFHVENRMSVENVCIL